MEYREFNSKKFMLEINMFNSFKYNTLLQASEALEKCFDVRIEITINNR